MITRDIVLKIEDGMDRRDVYSTHYQLRNLYHNFRDGALSPTDGFNLLNLLSAADLCPKRGRVLDVACGRGLLIPFLRYRAECALYLGVDNFPRNAIWKDGRDPRKRSPKRCTECGHKPPYETKDWGFPTIFVESDTEDMAGPIRTKLDDPEAVFDLIVYTSSIEHQQPSAQREPTESELMEWLADAGWEAERSKGLLTKATAIKNRLTGADLDRALELRTQLPSEFAFPFIATFFPEAATEKAYLCRRAT